MKVQIFLIANPKFQLQIRCSFGDITRIVKLNGIPENNFLCIFITASSPGVHTFLPLESKEEATSGRNFTKCISEVKVNQLKVKNVHVKMGISTFNFMLMRGQRASQIYLYPKTNGPPTWHNALGGLWVDIMTSTCSAQRACRKLQRK